MTTSKWKEGHRYHMRADLLDLLESKRKLRHMLIDGKPASDAEARAHIRSLIERGVLCVPVGDCDNFDDREGCMGHPTGAA